MTSAHLLSATLSLLVSGSETVGRLREPLDVEIERVRKDFGTLLTKRKIKTFFRLTVKEPKREVLFEFSCPDDLEMASSRSRKDVFAFRCPADKRPVWEVVYLGSEDRVFFEHSKDATIDFAKLPTLDERLEWLLFPAHRRTTAEQYDRETTQQDELVFREVRARRGAEGLSDFLVLVADAYSGTVKERPFCKDGSLSAWVIERERMEPTERAALDAKLAAKLLEPLPSGKERRTAVKRFLRIARTLSPDDPKLREAILDRLVEARDLFGFQGSEAFQADAAVVSWVLLGGAVAPAKAGPLACELLGGAFERDSTYRDKVRIGAAGKLSLSIAVGNTVCPDVWRLVDPARAEAMGQSCPSIVAKARADLAAMKSEQFRCGSGPSDLVPYIFAALCVQPAFEAQLGARLARSRYEVNASGPDCSGYPRLLAGAPCTCEPRLLVSAKVRAFALPSSQTASNYGDCGFVLDDAKKTMTTVYGLGGFPAAPAK